MNVLFALVLAASTLLAVRAASPSAAASNPLLTTPTPTVIIIGEPS